MDLFLELRDCGVWLQSYLQRSNSWAWGGERAWDTWRCGLVMDRVYCRFSGFVVKQRGMEGYGQWWGARVTKHSGFCSSVQVGLSGWFFVFFCLRTSEKSCITIGSSLWYVGGIAVPPQNHLRSSWGKDVIVGNKIVHRFTFDLRQSLNKEWHYHDLVILVFVSIFPFLSAFCAYRFLADVSWQDKRMEALVLLCLGWTAVGASLAVAHRRKNLLVSILRLIYRCIYIYIYINIFSVCSVEKFVYWQNSQ